MKIFTGLLLLSLITIRLSAQSPVNTYVIIKKSENIEVYNNLLHGRNTKFNIINLNCFLQQSEKERFLIHLVVFSDTQGKFNKNIVSASKILDSRHITIQELFKTAIANVRMDQKREITYFSFEDPLSKDLAIKSSTYRIAFENNDSTYSIYDNFTSTFFYEVKDYRQFTPVQSCATLINIKSILQPIPRTEDTTIGEPEITFPDSSYGDYFPDKLFLERINKDSSFHFVRYRQLSHDQWQNYNYEFDFDRHQGITRFWYYLPSKKGFAPLTSKRKYIKFVN